MQKSSKIKKVRIRNVSFKDHIPSTSTCWVLAIIRIRGRIKSGSGWTFLLFLAYLFLMCPSFSLMIHFPPFFLWSKGYQRRNNSAFLEIWTFLIIKPNLKLGPQFIGLWGSRYAEPLSVKISQRNIIGFTQHIWAFLGLKVLAENINLNTTNYHYQAQHFILNTSNVNLGFFSIVFFLIKNNSPQYPW